MQLDLTQEDTRLIAEALAALVNDEVKRLFLLEGGEKPKVYPRVKLITNLQARLLSAIVEQYE